MRPVDRYIGSPWVGRKLREAYGHDDEKDAAMDRVCHKAPAAIVPMGELGSALVIAKMAARRRMKKEARAQFLRERAAREREEHFKPRHSQA